MFGSGFLNLLILRAISIFVWSRRTLLWWWPAVLKWSITKWVSEQTGDTLIADSNAYGAIVPGKYRAIATDQYGCSSYLTAPGLQDARILKWRFRGAEIPVCDRDTATLTADVDNDVRYKWNTGDTAKNILCPKSGVFMLYGVSRFGCYSSDTANPILNDIPNNGDFKNLGFCPGKSTDVTVSGAQSYLWSNGSTSTMPSLMQRVPSSLLALINMAAISVSTSIFISSMFLKSWLWFPSTLNGLIPLWISMLPPKTW